MLSVFAAFLGRALLVALFLPFSALDKVLNFNEALSQAEQRTPGKWTAAVLVASGLGIEVFMSLAILTGVLDRLAAVILAGYCIITALLWKQFWTIRGFRLSGPQTDRGPFWDFLKNIALAGGFLLFAFGTDSAGVRHFFADPLTSSHPYSQGQP
ncbi:MAG: DoxX family membrane protein [Burkholderiaceae bacterium]|jgi:putative oxidoreductase